MFNKGLVEEPDGSTIEEPTRSWLGSPNRPVPPFSVHPRFSDVFVLQQRVAFWDHDDDRVAAHPPSPCAPSGECHGGRTSHISAQNVLPDVERRPVRQVEFYASKQGGGAKKDVTGESSWILPRRHTTHTVCNSTQLPRGPGDIHDFAFGTSKWHGCY